MRHKINGALLLIIATGVICCACGTDNSVNTTVSGAKDQKNEQVNYGEELSVAYQYGLAYAPLIMCQENSLIENAYKELTGSDLTVIWNQMSAGADINTGFAAGSIDVGFMGVAPAITGISKNVGYKIFTNMSGQEHGLMSNDPSIKNLSDIIGSSNQIALVNIGSIQHIILAKALFDNGYDAHALDSNIVAMKHPDGMASVESGSIACHLTTNPYIYIERENPDLHELDEVKEAWPVDNSFIVGVASESLYANNPNLYSAVCEAINNAIDMINGDFENVAHVTCEYDGNAYEDELIYLKKGVYSTETKGILELSQFMYQYEFSERSFESYSELVFDNVKGD